MWQVLFAIEQMCTLAKAERLPSLEVASLQVMKLYRHGASFDTIERFLRKISAPIYLFGEVPALSRCSAGCDVFNNLPFALRVSVRHNYDHARQGVDPGCWDANVNLARLKTTGFIVIKEIRMDTQSLARFAEQEVKRLIMYGSRFSESRYKEPYYSAIRIFLHENVSFRSQLKTKGVVISHWVC